MRGAGPAVQIAGYVDGGKMKRLREGIRSLLTNIRDALAAYYKKRKLPRQHVRPDFMKILPVSRRSDHSLLTSLTQITARRRR
jgi:hypothetical protein